MPEISENGTEPLINPAKIPLRQVINRSILNIDNTVPLIENVNQREEYKTQVVQSFTQAVSGIDPDRFDTLTAADFLTQDEWKPNREKLSPTALDKLISSFQQMVDNENFIETKKGLEKLATIDELTGLKNRRGFNQYFRTLLRSMIESYRFIHANPNQPERRANTPPTRLTLGILDTDNFKRVNDAAGMIMGDTVLQYIGKVLNSNLRPEEHISRWGGEEFAIIIPDNAIQAGSENIDSRINTIRIEASKFKFPNDISVTLSGGVGHFTVNDVMNIIQSIDPSEKAYENDNVLDAVIRKITDQVDGYKQTAKETPGKNVLINGQTNREYRDPPKVS
jgi:diguanylate cyclase (GGDEF)-like protein